MDIEFLSNNAHAVAVLFLTALALFMFTRPTLPLETSALAVLGLLAAGFALFPYSLEDGSLFQATDLLAGFAHPALIAVCGLMILGHGLVRTGALESVGGLLANAWRKNARLSLLMTMLLAAFLSSFVNNTPIIILLLPVLVSVCLKNNINPSAIMMPVNFATLLGGMGTTIGTSTNIIVVSVALEMGLAEFGLFDFMIPAVVVGFFGILYLWLIAPRLLPARKMALSDESAREFTAHLLFEPGNPFIGKSVSELIRASHGKMQIKRIRRGEGGNLRPLPDSRVREHDQLLVRDTPANLKSFERVLGCTLHSGKSLFSDENPEPVRDRQLAEIAIYPGSPMHRRSIAESHLYRLHEVIVLAIHRRGRPISSMPQGIQNVKLRLGDILLVQGSAKAIASLSQADMMVLSGKQDLPHHGLALRSLVIMASVIAIAASQTLPLAITALLGVLAMLVTGCLNWKDIRDALSAQLILMIATTLALGQALLLTGGSELIATAFLQLTASLSPAMTLAGLMLVMAILTNIISNNAAAIIGTPIAISVAHALNAPAEAFVLAVLFGANLSFVTPMAYQTNLLVMNAVNYRFSDFVRVGLPLALLMWLGFSLILAWMYGLG